MLLPAAEGSLHTRPERPPNTAGQGAGKGTRRRAPGKSCHHGFRPHRLLPPLQPKGSPWQQSPRHEGRGSRTNERTGEQQGALALTGSSREAGSARALRGVGWRTGRVTPPYGTLCLGRPFPFSVACALVGRGDPCASLTQGRDTISKRPGAEGGEQTSGVPGSSRASGSKAELRREPRAGGPRRRGAPSVRPSNHAGPAQDSPGVRSLNPLGGRDGIGGTLPPPEPSEL